MSDAAKHPRAPKSSRPSKRSPASERSRPSKRSPASERSRPSKRSPASKRARAPETIDQIGEFALIRRIEAVLATAGPDPAEVVVGIGDDAAVVRPDAAFDWVFTCDAQVAGRHFRPNWIEPRTLGRRIAHTNLSDIAAMGAEPWGVLVSLGLPGSMSVALVEDLYRGFLDALEGTRARVIGGNLTESGPDWFCDLTVCGRVARGGAITRRGARPGDRILVTGSPGRSAAGLAILERLDAEPIDGPIAFRERCTHFSKEQPWALPLIDAYLEPTARLTASARLASGIRLKPGGRSATGSGSAARASERSAARASERPAARAPERSVARASEQSTARAAERSSACPDTSVARPTAMMDISDGLPGDLERICEQSGVRARIEIDRLPVDGVLEAAAAWFGRARAEWSLLPGDDYELLFTAAPEHAARLAASVRATGLAATDIGEILPAPGSGEATGVEITGLPPGASRPVGWDHFRQR